MLFDTHRTCDSAHLQGGGPLEYRTESKNISDCMDQMERLPGLRESALPFFMCTGGLKLRVIGFEPLDGMYLGICGPEPIPYAFSAPFHCDGPYSTFILLLEGKWTCVVKEAGDTIFEVGKNGFLAGDWKGVRGESRVPAQEAYCHVCITARAGAIERHFGPNLARDVERILHWRENGGRRRIPTTDGLASPDLVSSGRRLLTMSKAGPINTMELRSACLDFFTRMLRNAASPPAVPVMALPEQDVLALTRLKEYIERNCLEAPGTAGLCALAGMSESKGNKAFKQLFKVTIARHVHNCKMQYAHVMLGSRKRNVSECAFDVGYTNIGHFIAAYRKHYGHTPGSAYRGAL